jgi:hypothetical protein
MLEEYPPKEDKVSQIFPAQMQRARKEQVYLTAIDLFDKGKTWENAIELLKTLAEQCVGVCCLCPFVTW